MGTPAPSLHCFCFTATVSPPSLDGRPSSRLGRRGPPGQPLDFRICCQTSLRANEENCREVLPQSFLIVVRGEPCSTWNDEQAVQIIQGSPIQFELRTSRL